MNYKSESSLMALMKRMGFHSIAWSLRRLHCPVNSEDLVLEVGSGGNPYFRSNILYDAYFETRERHWEPLITDRPTLLGFAERMPFKDKSFDFVIASHVLEHSKDPELFISELERVAKAGYIEVPDAFMERINPYLDHRLEITVRENILLIKKKSDHKVDHELSELYEDKANQVIAGETMRKHPFHFHVRYYWQDKINYKILNPEIDAGWPIPESTYKIPGLSKKAKLQKWILKVIRKLFSQRKRNKRIDLRDFLICPKCGSQELSWGNEILCVACKSKFSVLNGIPNMTVAPECAHK